MTRIPSWPASERPRERLLRDGVQALSDAELVALLLRTGVRGQSAVDLARVLLARFDGVRGLLDASPGKLKAVRGLGHAKVCQFAAAGELVRRALMAKARRQSVQLSGPNAVSDYLRLRIGARGHEVFISIFLDSRHRVIHAEESSRGTIAHTTVYPREIVKQALAVNAAALIVAHNHPSGDPEPSAADRQLTETLREALALVDVPLLDHLIITADMALSFAAKGWM